MMKAVLLSFVFINLYAQIQWIPLEPINEKESAKADSNKSQVPHANNLLDNVKVIQHLLDKKSDTNNSATDGKKNWFRIKI